MKKLNRIRIACIVLFLFAAWIAWETSQIREMMVSNEPGPKLFPYISAVGIAVCSILIYLFDGAKEKETEPYLTRDGWKRLLLFMAEVIIYGIGIYYAGFLLSTLVMLFIMIMTLKGGKKISILFALLFTIAATCIIYYGFKFGFQTNLPTERFWKLLGINFPFD